MLRCPPRSPTWRAGPRIDLTDPAELTTQPKHGERDNPLSPRAFG
jgi:hypothetical protein